MPNPVNTEYPDIMPAFFDALETALTSQGAEVAEDLTGWHYPEKRVTISPSGGTMSPVRLAAPQFDVNVYAKTKHDAMGLALKACKALFDMRNHVGSDYVITAVDCSYPQDLSDPINHNPRFVFDLTVTYRRR